MKETKFKMTEVGMIPQEWEVKCLGEIGTFSKGRGISRAESGTGEIAAIRYGEIYTSHNDYIKDFFSFISPSVAEQSKQLKCGDILFAASGETKEDIAKAVAFVEPNVIAYAGGDIIILSPNIQEDSKFLGFLLNTVGVIKQRASKAQGDAVVHITSSSIASIKIPFPPLAEQSRIASALSSIDNLLSSLDKLIAKKQAIKQGAMQQLLTGNKRLKGFKEEWKTVTLEDYFDLGNGYTPSKANPAFWTNGTIPWFRMEDIRTNGHILKDSIQHVTHQAVKASGLFPKYSIILSTTATIGEHALLIADSLANQRFTFLNRKVNRIDEVDIMYFYWHCFLLGDWCRANINSGGLLAVNMDDLKAYQFPLPSIPEQRAIASVLTSMDNELAALAAKKQKYGQIKQGMMQQLLTGKVRLT